VRSQPGSNLALRWLDRLCRMLGAVFLVAVLSAVALTSVYRAESSVSTDQCLRFNGISHPTAEQRVACSSWGR